jgi:hypothetical protein
MLPKHQLKDQKNRYRNKKPIKNRKNRQKKYYSGKKKRHTLKTGVIADKKTGQIICTNFSNGKKHDFRLFKESKIHINEKIKIMADTGFQGIHKFHKNSEIPKKKTKKRSLTKQEKKNNREISSQRVKIENIIGFVKRFKILADKYRNRRKRFGLRFNLIAGICNFDLKI